MLVLAVESATETAAVALADEEGLLGSTVVARGRRHTETMASSIESLCRRVGVTLDEVGALAVDVGPGLFTGLRVGVGTVQALAFALEVPVVAVSSLEVLAHGAFGGALAPGTTVVAVVDARRAQVFASRFRDVGGTVSELSDAAVWNPEDLAADLAATDLAAAGAPAPLVLVGNGARRYRSLFAERVPEALLGGPALSSPPVMALAEVGVARALSGATVEGAAVLPLYLRAADARINWEQRIPARPARPGAAS